METKTAEINLRVEPSTKKQIQIEAHLMNQSMSQMILGDVYSGLIERNIKAAKIYEEMAKAEPDAEKKSKLKALCNNSIRRGHFWISKHKSVDEAEEIYKEIESLSSYRDALLEEVNA